MWISNVQLLGFRNYDQAAIDLEPGLNLLFGENGRGKTNLVEAIYFLGTQNSHRVAQNSNLIKSSAHSSTLSAKAEAGSRQLLLAAELNRESANRYFVNGSQQKRSQDFVGLIRPVMFSPEDLDLVRRDPADRRSFLDQAIALLKPRMQGVKSDYDRVLKQRNALLKSAKSVAKPDLTTLEIWDEQLVALGAQIVMARLDLVSSLVPILSDFYKKLSQSEDETRITIRSSIAGGDEDSFGLLENVEQSALQEMFHGKLLEHRSSELERGITLVGPHRDEMLIEKAGLPARTQSSQGEAWSLALGLKLALAQLLRQDSLTGDPILILDDVFSVLDSGRRSRLVEFVADYEQVLVTSADRASAPDLNWQKSIEVLEGGQLGTQF